MATNGSNNDLFKVPTGSIGPQGEQIFDIFRTGGTAPITEREFSGLGVDVANVPVGEAPEGFVSQFAPVQPRPIAPIPADELGDVFTDRDVLRELQNRRASQDKAFERLVDLSIPTQQEAQLTSDIEELNEMLRQGVQKVEERALEGGLLKSALAQEINNIAQGNTRESLAILRSIDTKTRLLTAEQRARQNQIEVEKLKLDREGANEQSLMNIYNLIREMERDQLAREDRLNTNQDNFLKRITDRYIGLQFSELDPQLQRDIAGEANRLDPSGALLAGIRNRLNIEKQAMELDRLNTMSLISQRGGDSDISLSTANKTALLGAGLSSAEISALEKDINQFGLTEVLKNQSLTDTQRAAIEKAYGVSERVTMEQLEKTVTQKVAQDGLKNAYTEEELIEFAEEGGFGTRRFWFDKSDKDKVLEYLNSDSARKKYIELLAEQYRAAGMLN